MVLCHDPDDETCQKDLETLCPVGFHLCTYIEFNQLNDAWNITVPSTQRPVGEIYCRSSSAGAGHFAVGYGSTIHLDNDEPLNCWISSSRVSCPSSYGCNDKHVSALCC